LLAITLFEQGDLLIRHMRVLYGSWCIMICIIFMLVCELLIVGGGDGRGRGKSEGYFETQKKKQQPIILPLFFNKKNSLKMVSFSILKSSLFFLLNIPFC